jgi:hemoglobin/transferrin/lactoferrin receptor protein
LLLCLFLHTAVVAQQINDTLLRELNEIVISVNKFAEKKKNIAQKVEVISSKYISHVNTQNTGDLLQSTGNVFVQKSQQGGSSPIIRGFEASRVLLIVDGVRMNNLIYRSGHLQNVITVDQNMLQSVEVLYGPSSTLYGSDALGGAVHFRTKTPLLAPKEKKMLRSGNFFTRFSSANMEKTIHSDYNLGWEKFAWLQSYTFSDFGDMRMGSNYPEKYPDFGRRDSLITRVNGIDSVIKNTDHNLQKFSGYRQWDMLHKFLFKPSEKITHTLNLQVSNTTNVPRYDRLQDKRNNTLRWAEWNYGPQTRIFSAYEFNIKKSGWLDQININVNYQHIEESRIQRQYRIVNQEARVERVNVYGFIADARKVWENHELSFGVDGQYNSLKSMATVTNIDTKERKYLADTRYPNGKNYMMNAALFGQHIYKLSSKIILNDGIRFQYSRLYSSIADNSFRQLPYTEINQNNIAFTGNIGAVFLPSSKNKISTNISSGFRVPNIDDLAKIFESGTTGNTRQVVVPNPDIKPERTYNIDINYLQGLGKHVRLEASAFYTWFIDALVMAPFSYNGKDSIIYNGVKSQVLANLNANKAFLYGFSAGLCFTLKAVTLSSTIQYTQGRFETDPNLPSQIYEKQPNGAYRLVKKKVSSKPLDHIPPLFGKTSIRYEKAHFFAEFFAQYNGWKQLEDYNADGEDNAQYATADGMPSWWTLNARMAYTFKNITVQLLVENITDRNYRQFASGFSAPGRNIVMALRWNY